jgi:hypothetical protein
MEWDINIQRHGVTTIEFSHPQNDSMPTKQLEKTGTQNSFAGTHNMNKSYHTKTTSWKRH